MRISKKPQLTDQELFSPQQLFTTLRGMSKDLPSNEEKQPKPTKRRKDFLNEMEIMLQENQLNADPKMRSERKSKQFMGLKKIIQQQKIKALIRNFVVKLKRNNVNSDPMQYEPFQETEKDWFEHEGFVLPLILDNLWALSNIIQITLLTLFYTLSLVFTDVLQSEIAIKFQTFSIFFYITEMILNFVTIKSVEGRKLTTLKQIGYHYMGGKFALDLISIIILVLDVSFNTDFLIYIRLIITFKIAGCMEILEKLQNVFIDNFYKEQYWGLIKVFMLNFCFAHFLAVVLVAMANVEPSNSWISTRGWNFAPWYQIYAWAYYWGTTIMLTVGFGDIAATNFKQAICLTLISTFSCITLAYNINCVGNLISNIRSQDIQKNKNFKVFNKLTEKNDIPQELSWRINNYIQESTNIKKKFNFEQENTFISKLPQGLKADFLKESNKKIFEGLIFFRNLTEKTLLNFAEKIEMRICHPQQVIRRKDGEFNLFILKEGHIGFVCKKSNFQYNDTLIDEINIQDKDQPFLLSLDFISKQKKPCEMKSLKYSILYWLNQTSTISVLQSSQLDYQHFCQLRDKSRHIVDEYQVFTCDLCGQHHMKFDCPKIHFIPIEQHVILRHLHDLKKISAKRLPYFRNKKRYSTLRMRRKQTNKESPLLKSPVNSTVNDEKKVLSQKDALIRLKTLFSSRHDVNDQDQYYNQGAIDARKLLENVSHNIVTQVTKIVNAAKPPEIWIVECDEVRNYKFYFNQNNANQLWGVYQGK